ncbi:MAG: T9SS type A sorting domain-containing protein [Saprospiraceae bacterium]|nr:T9SS type A sorting domain-containing protein [Saprospiraceae bacterium]
MKYLFTFLCTLSFLSSHTQCFMDQHSTTWYDGWISCKSKTSPNPARGEGHWILYNLGHRYALGESYWWNNNENNALQHGVKRMSMDISLDGINWVSLSDFELPIASGKPTYEGTEGPDFENVEARYILLTALENYGGSCYSFGEMKINVALSTNTADETNLDYCMNVKVYPNPFQNSTQIEVSSNCDGDVIVKVEDAYGRQIGKVFTVERNNDNTFTFNGQHLLSGIYFISVQSDKQKIRQKLIKID